MIPNHSLLVMEEEELKKYPLFEIKQVDTSALEYKVNIETILNYWPKARVDYSPLDLGKIYTREVKKIFQRFEPFAGSDKLLEQMIKVEVIFATKEAYSRKRKEEKADLKDKTVGCFCRVEGIHLSLQKDLDQLSATIIHEYAHFLHAQLQPEQYHQATAEMKEMVAILLHESFGYKPNYYENTPHDRAKKLLHRLYGSPFKKIGFAAQWDLLTSIISINSPLFTASILEETT